MRDAETILGIIRERGTQGLPLERVYRLLFNRELYLLAYGRLYRNAGALTRGATAETVDGMSLAKIDLCWPSSLSVPAWPHRTFRYAAGHPWRLGSPRGYTRVR